MSDFVFNIAKGRIAAYADLAAANDALVVVPLLSAGLEADGTLKDYDTVAALLAGSSDEQTTIGRKTIASGVTISVDDVNDRADIDIPDQSWSAATGAGVGALVLAYDNDTTGGDDSYLIPLVKLDFSVTPNGGAINLVVNAAGVARAS